MFVGVCWRCGAGRVKEHVLFSGRWLLIDALRPSDSVQIQIFVGGHFSTFVIYRIDLLVISYQIDGGKSRRLRKNIESSRHRWTLSLGVRVGLTEFTWASDNAVLETQARRGPVTGYLAAVEEGWNFFAQLFITNS